MLYAEDFSMHHYVGFLQIGLHISYFMRQTVVEVDSRQKCFIIRYIST